MKEHILGRPPTVEDTVEAVWGTWNGTKRKAGLMERMARIEIILGISLSILTAKALGVPTDHAFDLVKRFVSVIGIFF